MNRIILLIALFLSIGMGGAAEMIKTIISFMKKQLLDT